MIEVYVITVWCTLNQQTVYVNVVRSWFIVAYTKCFIWFKLETDTWGKLSFFVDVNNLLINRLISGILKYYTPFFLTEIKVILMALCFTSLLHCLPFLAAIHGYVSLLFLLG